MRSIRMRLTLWYVSLLTLTFIVVGGAAYALLSYSLLHEMDNALGSVARVVSERVQGGTEAFFPSEVDEIFRRYFGFSPWEKYFQMLDPSGRKFSGKSGLHPQARIPIGKEALENAARGISTFETVQGRDGNLVRIMIMPVMHYGRLEKLIQVGMSLQSISLTRTRFLLIMAGLFPVVLIMAGLGGSMLARRALSPIGTMTETANRISAERLAERLEESGAGDEVDRLAKTLNRMLGRLDTAFSQIRQFTADASHELQTPLTILKGELEVALRAPRPREEYEATLRSALEEIDRIAHLVEGLLLLARNEAGVLRMDKKEIDLALLSEEVCESLRTLADSKSLALHLESPKSVCFRADREHMRRLLRNLVENAIKYTKPEGSVALAVENEGDQVSIRVSDTGIGISAEDRERIFQPFFRSEEALSESGVGLGLSIVKSIAEAHSGTIRVESAPGRGSSFVVLLPAF